MKRICFFFGFSGFGIPSAKLNLEVGGLAVRPNHAQEKKQMIGCQVIRKALYKGRTTAEDTLHLSEIVLFFVTTLPLENAMILLQFSHRIAINSFQCMQ